MVFGYDTLSSSLVLLLVSYIVMWLYWIGTHSTSTEGNCIVIGKGILILSEKRKGQKGKVEQGGIQDTYTVCFLGGTDCWKTLFLVLTRSREFGWNTPIWPSPRNQYKHKSKRLVYAIHLLQWNAYLKINGAAILIW